MRSCLLLELAGCSDDKESACNVGDLSLIPGWGRTPCWGGMATYSSILAWRIPIDRGACLAGYSPLGHKESDVTD